MIKTLVEQHHVNVIYIYIYIDHIKLPGTDGHDLHVFLVEHNHVNVTNYVIIMSYISDLSSLIIICIISSSCDIWDLRYLIIMSWIIPIFSKYSWRLVAGPLYARAEARRIAGACGRDHRRPVAA